MIPFNLLVGLSAARLLALCELQRLFLLFLWLRVVSSHVCTDQHLTDDWRRTFCSSPECSLQAACVFLVLCLENSTHHGLRTFPALSLQIRETSMPGFFLPVPVWKLSRHLQCSLVSFSSFGNSFPDIQCLHNCFFIYFVQLFLFIVSGWKVKSVPFTPSQPKSEVSQYSSKTKL